MLDAAATSELIQRLAQIRAQMDPPIQRDWTARDAIDVAYEPAMKFGLTHEGRFLIAMRHHGLGWCCFDFELQTAAALRDFIAKRTANIIGHGLDDTGGTAH